MIFQSIKNPEIKKGELVKVRLYEGTMIMGYVFSVDKNNFWLTQDLDSNSMPYRFSFKIDQIIKYN